MGDKGNGQFSTNKFGIKLFTDSLVYDSQPTSTVLINNSAKCFFTQNINDTLNWVNLKFSFISDSNYKYIAIGNFFDDLSCNPVKEDNSSISSNGYYYIDDVCISNDSNTCNISNQLACIFTSIKKETEKDKMFLYPNPCDEYFYIKNITKEINWKLISIDNVIVRSGIISESEYIKINDLPESVYVLQLNTDEGVLRKKIIVKH